MVRGGVVGDGSWNPGAHRRGHSARRGVEVDARDTWKKAQLMHIVNKINTLFITWFIQIAKSKN